MEKRDPHLSIHKCNNHPHNYGNQWRYPNSIFLSSHLNVNFLSHIHASLDNADPIRKRPRNKNIKTLLYEHWIKFLYIPRIDNDRIQQNINGKESFYDLACKIWINDRDYIRHAIDRRINYLTKKFEKVYQALYQDRDNQAYASLCECDNVR